MLAVVLCGPGHDLWPIKSPCKALLPAAQHPLVEGVLHWVSEAGLTGALISSDRCAAIHRDAEALLLAPASQQAALSHFVRSWRHSDTKSTLKVDLETFESEEAQGTAKVIAWAATKGYIKGDFVVLPCDLAIRAAATSTSNALSTLLAAHKTSDDLVTSLFFERPATEKGKETQSRFMVIYEAKAKLLLDVKNLADYEDQEEVPIRSSLLRAHPSARIATNLLPAHVYACSARVLSILAQIPRFDSFKLDLIPFLAKAQWQKGLIRAYNEGPALTELRHPQALALSHSTTAPVPEKGSENVAAGPSKPARPSLRNVKSSVYGTLLTSAYSSNDVRPSDASPRPPADAAHWPRSNAVRIHVWKPADGLCMRVTNVASYAELNRLALRAIAEPEGVAGHHLTKGEKASIKRSAIGDNCNVGKMARITACVLMDNVAVGDGAKLDACIIGPNVRIGENAVLTNCEVGEGVFIDAGTQLKGEKLAHD